MKKVALLATVLLCAAVATATEIRSYDAILRVADGGAATGSAKISIAEAQPGLVTIPLGFAARNVRLTSAPAGTTMTAEPFNGQTRLRIAFAALPPGDVRLQLSFDVEHALFLPEPPAGQQRVLPEGAWMLRHGLVATEPATIRRYRCEVLFPQSLRAHAIREALPKQGLKEPEPRVQLARIEGAAGARLQAGPLVQGDTASMEIELVPQTHSPLWIIVGVLLSIAYLIKFRNLITGANGSGSPDADDDEELS